MDSILHLSRTLQPGLKEDLGWRRGNKQTKKKSTSNRLKTKILPAISVNKGCCGRQASTLQPRQEPCRNSGRRQRSFPLPSPSSSQLLQPRWQSTLEPHDGKTRGISPRELRYTWKEWFPWAQTLALSLTYKQKGAKFLNLWWCLVFFKQEYFFKAPSTWFCCRNSHISWLPSFLLEAAPQCYLTCSLPG